MEQFTCDDISAVLSGFLDGALDERRQHLADVHLAKCERCRAMVNVAEELDAEVRASVGSGEESGWSDELERRILLSINDPVAEWRLERRLRISALSGWVTAIAALMMIVFLLVYENDVNNSGGAGATDVNRPASLSSSTNLRLDASATEGVDAASGNTAIANRNVVEDRGDGAVSADRQAASLEEGPIDANRFAINDGVNDARESEERSATSGAGAGANDSVTVEEDSGFTAIDLLGDYSAISSRLAVFVPDESAAAAPLSDWVDVGDEVDTGSEERDGAGIDSARLASGRITNNDDEDAGGVGDGDTGGVSSSVSEDDDWKYGTDDVLYSAAVALEALADADVNSFSDVREINQALEYDDLLDKLAESRDEMWGEDASLVDRAWAALEWVSGPVDQAQLVRVQAMIADENLAVRLEMLSDEYGTY